MKAEIITIGDEILIGQIVNTNSTWIAEQLSLIGVHIYQITSVPDDRDHIIKTLKDAVERADLIIITGGLGPTKDDVTKLTLSEFFNTNMEFNEEAYQDIKKLFKNRGLELNELNKKQAELPANCRPLRNLNGTAPGMWFEENDKIYISMPGVPFEMKPIVTDQVIPLLRKKCGTDTIVHKTILTQGIGESWLSEKISDWEDNLPDNIRLAYLPQPGIVRLRLTAVGKGKNRLQEQINEEIEKLKSIIPHHIFGYDNDTLEAVVGNKLREKKKTVVTAESCTGGYIAHLITSVAGSSDYYKGSVVAYSNEIKETYLNVEHNNLLDHGAVSEPVVRQMAEGARQKFNTDFAIATSGIAGPSGGSDEKPVGTTWIAVATPDKVIAEKFLFGEERGRNIRKTALQALNMLRRELI